MSHASLRSRLANVHVYAVTPFRDDALSEIDWQGFESNLEFLVEQGVQVIAVGGGTGEIDALSIDELESLARTALQVVGDRALVVTCLPGNLKEASILARRYEELGSQIALGMPPFVRGKVPADLEGVFEYYRLLARASGLPLMPYNTQGWPARFIARFAEIDRMVGIKDPCAQPHEFFKAIRLVGDRLVWIGNKQHDPGVLQFRYQMGMQGFTSGQGNFIPGPELAMHVAAQEKNWDLVVDLQLKAAPLEQLRAAHDDAAMVKAGMDLVGLKGGRVRPPRRDVHPEGRAALATTLAELEVR